MRYWDTQFSDHSEEQVRWTVRWVPDVMDQGQGVWGQGVSPWSLAPMQMGTQVYERPFEREGSLRMVFGFVTPELLQQQPNHWSTSRFNYADITTREIDLARLKTGEARLLRRPYLPLYFRSFCIVPSFGPRVNGRHCSQWAWRSGHNNQHLARCFSMLSNTYHRSSSPVTQSELRPQDRLSAMLDASPNDYLAEASEASGLSMTGSLNSTLAFVSCHLSLIGWSSMAIDSLSRSPRPPCDSEGS
jgi:hypothetical protein